MKVLHYIHGMPPVKGGGLIKYAMDLVQGQKSRGHSVAIITPGAFYDGSQTEASLDKGTWEGIDVYRIINSIPVTDGRGIREMELLRLELPNHALVQLIKEGQFDMIHIHSMMGLPKLLLQCAKEEKIPVIYTTHDYYGLCPKAILLDHGKQCTDCSGAHCAQCLGAVPSAEILTRTHGRLYMWLRQTWLVKCLEYSPYLIPLKRFIYDLQGKTYHHADQAAKRRKKLSESGMPGREEYVELQAYYRELFDYITFFHYNSEQSRSVFESVLGARPGEVLSVSNVSISNNVKEKQFGEKLRIGYIGRDVYKGFELLKQALGNLYRDGCTNFECQIYNNTKQKLPSYFKMYPPYAEKEKREVYERMDVLVLPSVWKETFSMVVPEALSYGVPVIISENVGAKDLLKINPNVGIVTEVTADALTETLKKVYTDRSILEAANKEICKWDYPFSYEKHVMEVEKLYEDSQTQF